MNGPWYEETAVTPQEVRDKLFAKYYTARKEGEKLGLESKIKEVIKKHMPDGTTDLPSVRGFSVWGADGAMRPGSPHGDGKSFKERELKNEIDKIYENAKKDAGGLMHNAHRRKSRHSKGRHSKSRHNKSRHNKSRHSKSRHNKSRHNKSRHNKSRHNKSRNNKSRNSKSRNSKKHSKRNRN